MYHPLETHDGYAPASSSAWDNRSYSPSLTPDQHCNDSGITNRDGLVIRCDDINTANNTRRNSCGPRRSYEPGAEDVLSTPARPQLPPPQTRSFNNYASLVATARKPSVSKRVDGGSSSSGGGGGGGGGFWSHFSRFTLSRKGSRSNKRGGAKDEITIAAVGGSAPPRPSLSSPPQPAAETEKTNEPEIADHPVFRDSPFAGQQQLITIPPLPFEDRPVSGISFDAERFRASMASFSSLEGGEGVVVGRVGSSPYQYGSWDEGKGASGDEEGFDSGDDESESVSAGSWDSEDAREEERRCERKLKELRRRRERNKKIKASQRMGTPVRERQREGDVDSLVEQQIWLQQQWLQRNHAENEREAEPQRASQDWDNVEVHQHAEDEELSQRGGELQQHQSQQSQQQRTPRPRLSTDGAHNNGAQSFIPRLRWKRGSGSFEGINDVARVDALKAAYMLRNKGASALSKVPVPIRSTTDTRKQSTPRVRLQKPQSRAVVEQRLQDQLNREEGEELRRREREAVRAVLSYCDAVLKKERERQRDLSRSLELGSHAREEAEEEKVEPRRSVSLRRRLSWRKPKHGYAQERREKEAEGRRTSGELSRSSSLRHLVFGRTKDWHHGHGQGDADTSDGVRRSLSFINWDKKRPDYLRQFQSCQDEEEDVLNSEEEGLTRPPSLQRMPAKAGYRNPTSQVERRHYERTSDIYLRDPKDNLRKKAEGEGRSSHIAEKKQRPRTPIPFRNDETHESDEEDDSALFPGIPWSYFPMPPQARPRPPLTSRIPQRPNGLSPRMRNPEYPRPDNWYCRSPPVPTKHPSRKGNHSSTFLHAGGEGYSGEILQQYLGTSSGNEQMGSPLCTIPEDDGETGMLRDVEKECEGKKTWDPERGGRVLIEQKLDPEAGVDGEREKDKRSSLEKFVGRMGNIKRKESTKFLRSNNCAGCKGSKTATNKEPPAISRSDPSRSVIRVSKGAVSKDESLGGEGSGMGRDSSGTMDTCRTSSTDMTTATASTDASSASEYPITFAAAEAAKHIRRMRTTVRFISGDEPGDGGYFEVGDVEGSVHHQGCSSTEEVTCGQQHQLEEATSPDDKAFAKLKSAQARLAGRNIPHSGTISHQQNHNGEPYEESGSPCNTPCEDISKQEVDLTGEQIRHDKTPNVEVQVAELKGTDC